MEGFAELAFFYGSEQTTVNFDDFDPSICLSIILNIIKLLRSFKLCSI